MKWLLALVLCSASLAAAQPARPAATAAFGAGQKLYAAGDYRAAAGKFIEAYAADPDPAYLFNIAQAYRFARACGDAARYYRQFLAAVEHLPSADRIRRYIAEMDGCTPAAPPPVTPAAVVAPPPLAARASARETGSTRRHVGLAAGAVGLVAVGAGAYFHHRVGVFEDRTNTCTPDAPCTSEQVNAWDRAAGTASTRAIVGYSVGGAALATGVTLYLLGRHTEHAVALAPVRAGAVVAAAFHF